MVLVSLLCWPILPESLLCAVLGAAADKAGFLNKKPSTCLTGEVRWTSGSGRGCRSDLRAMRQLCASGRGRPERQACCPPPARPAGAEQRPREGRRRGDADPLGSAERASQGSSCISEQQYMCPLGFRLNKNRKGPWARPAPRGCGPLRPSRGEEGRGCARPRPPREARGAGGRGGSAGQWQLSPCPEGVRVRAGQPPGGGALTTNPDLT